MHQTVFPMSHAFGCDVVFCFFAPAKEEGTRKIDATVVSLTSPPSLTCSYPNFSVATSGRELRFPQPLNPTCLFLSVPLPFASVSCHSRLPRQCRSTIVPRYQTRGNLTLHRTSSKKSKLGKQISFSVAGRQYIPPCFLCRYCPTAWFRSAACISVSCDVRRKEEEGTLSQKVMGACRYVSRESMLPRTFQDCYP